MSTTPIPAVTNTSNGVHGAHGVRGHHRRSQGTPLTGRSDSPSQSDYLAPPPHHHHHRRTPSSPLAQSFSSVDDDGHGDHEQTNSYPEPAGDGLDGPGPDADADDLPPFQGMTTTTLISPAPKGKGKGKPPAFEDRDNGDLSGPYTYTTGRRAGNIFSPQAALTGALLALPYVVLPLLQSLVEGADADAGSLDPDPDGAAQATLLVAHRSHLADSAAAASATLLLLGVFSAFIDSRGHAVAGERHGTTSSTNAVASRAISTLLPFYAACLLGGERVVAVLFVAFATGLPTLLEHSAAKHSLTLPPSLFTKHRAGLLFMVVLVVADLCSITSALDLADMVWGYTALFLTAIVIRPQWLTSQTSSSSSSPQSNGHHAYGLHSDHLHSLSNNNNNNNITQIDFISGGALAIFALFIEAVVGGQLFSIPGFLTAIVAGLCGAASVIFLTPSTTLRSASAPAVFLSSLLLEIVLTFALSGFRLTRLISQLSIVCLACVAVRLDLGMAILPTIHDHEPGETVLADGGQPQKEKPPSRMTVWLLHATEAWPFIQSILRQRDSRRIFYFMNLNLAFMVVQMAYGIATGSLGLISDSVHMLFDCFALAVGLAASIMSKWPPSERFPYGYGKVDTLAGFANGVFLMIISVEITYEAIERLCSGSEIQRIGELFVVSTLGLLVNLVGIFAFEHGHHGHSHGEGHDHDHGNENMHGIFLHILADALGSVAVVGSTALIHFFGWSGFDPLASCMIAILIFVSAIPLVISTSKTLLLSLPGDVEYSIRDALGGLNTVRGVVGYTVPKFWLDDTAPSHKHEHHHHHHDHKDHSHDHHSHHHEHHHHDHDHAHGHDHHHHEDTHKQGGQGVLGAIHIIAAPYADLGDVQRRATEYLRQRNMNAVVQVERDGDRRCWCGGGK